MAEHKQRARWRLIGALAFSLASAAVAMLVLRDTPRPLSQDFHLADASQAGFGSLAPVTPVAPVAPSPKVEPKAEPKVEPKVESKARTKAPVQASTQG